MATAEKELSESLENYLEAIHHIIADKQAARAKDIAARLQVKGSSVTGALRALADKGLINYAPYDIITFTPRGAQMAAAVVQRHRVVREFLVDVLGVVAAEAEETACRMEHVIPAGVFQRLASFVEFVRHCPRYRGTWAERLADFRHSGNMPADCQQCMRETGSEVNAAG